MTECESKQGHGDNRHGYIEPILLVLITYFLTGIGYVAYYPDRELGAVIGAFGGILVVVYLVDIVGFGLNTEEDTDD